MQTSHPAQVPLPGTLKCRGSQLGTAQLSVPMTQPRSVRQCQCTPGHNLLPSGTGTALQCTALALTHAQLPASNAG